MPRASSTTVRASRTARPDAPRHRRRARVGGRLVALTAAAVTTTVVAVGVGVLAGDPRPAGSAASLVAADLGLASDALELPRPTAAELRALEASRERALSRSGSRDEAKQAKRDLLEGENTSGGQVVRSKDLGDGDPRTIARALMPQFGFSADQFGCLDSLWTKESGWNPSADNPSSSAYGIPQALPGSKMASAGADWATNPATQIEWGLGYIQDRYGSPCAAWSHSQAANWY